MRNQNRSFEEKQNNFVARRLKEKGVDPSSASPSPSKNEVASMLSQQRRRSGSRDSRSRSQQPPPDSAKAPYAQDHFPPQNKHKPPRGEAARSASPSGSRVSSRELADMKARAHGDASPHFPSLGNKSQEDKRWQAHEMLGDHGHGHGHERSSNYRRNDDNHSVAQSTATNKSEYLLTLEQQMKEKEERKRKEKEEQAQWDKKMEDEAQRYDYFGSGRRGGGGEPVKDGGGSNVTSLKKTGKELATYSPSNRSVQSAYSNQQRDSAHRSGIRRGNQTNDSSGVMAALSFPEVDEGNENRRNSRSQNSPPHRPIQTSESRFQGREGNLSPRAEINSVGPPAYEDNNDERQRFASYGFHGRAQESKYDDYNEPESKFEDVSRQKPSGGAAADPEEVDSLRRQLREAKEIVADQHERLNEKDSLNRSLKEENESLHQEAERLRERLSTAISILENYRERYGPLE